MNLILLDPSDFVAADRVVLRDRRHAHVAKVHRAVCARWPEITSYGALRAATRPFDAEVVTARPGRRGR
jgi:hypothetical protein